VEVIIIMEDIVIGAPAGIEIADMIAASVEIPDWVDGALVLALVATTIGDQVAQTVLTVTVVTVQAIHVETLVVNVLATTTTGITTAVHHLVPLQQAMSIVTPATAQITLAKIIVANAATTIQGGAATIPDGVTTMDGEVVAQSVGAQEKILKTLK